jgi:integrase
MLNRRVVQGEAYIFHELQETRFGDRSVDLSKRLGRRLRSFGFTDKSLVASHSWRHRAATLLEQAGIVRDTCDYLLGHARPGEGRGRYSKGPSDEQLVAAARAVSLPAGS